MGGTSVGKGASKSTIFPLASAACAVRSSKLFTTSTGAVIPSGGVPTLPPEPDHVELPGARRHERRALLAAHPVGHHHRFPMHVGQLVLLHPGQHPVDRPFETGRTAEPAPVRVGHRGQPAVCRGVGHCGGNDAVGRRPVLAGKSRRCHPGRQRVRARRTGAQPRRRWSRPRKSERDAWVLSVEFGRAGRRWATAGRQRAEAGIAFRELSTADSGPPGSGILRVRRARFKPSSPGRLSQPSVASTPRLGEPDEDSALTVDTRARRDARAARRDPRAAGPGRPLAGQLPPQRLERSRTLLRRQAVHDQRSRRFGARGRRPQRRRQRLRLGQADDVGGGQDSGQRRGRRRCQGHREPDQDHRRAVAHRVRRADHAPPSGVVGELRRLSAEGERARREHAQRRGERGEA